MLDGSDVVPRRHQPPDGPRPTRPQPFRAFRRPGQHAILHQSPILPSFTLCVGLGDHTGGCGPAIGACIHPPAMYIKPSGRDGYNTLGLVSQLFI
jgi:hypothetical protein